MSSNINRLILSAPLYSIGRKDLRMKEQEIGGKSLLQGFFLLNGFRISPFSNNQCSVYNNNKFSSLLSFSYLYLTNPSLLCLTFVFFNAKKLSISDVLALLFSIIDVLALQVIITSINIDGNLLLIGSHQKEKVN